MAEEHNVYPEGFRKMLDGTIRWANDQVAAVILGPEYEPDPENHTTWGDVSGFMTSSDDHSPVLVPNRAVSLDSEARVLFTSDDISWGSEVSIEGHYCVFVRGNPDDLSSTDPLISLHDFGTNRESVAADFTLLAPSYWIRIQPV